MNAAELRPNPIKVWVRKKENDRNRKKSHGNLHGLDPSEMFFRVYPFAYGVAVLPPSKQILYVFQAPLLLGLTHDY